MSCEYLPPVIPVQDHTDLDLAIYGPEQIGSQRVQEMQALADKLLELMRKKDKFWLLADSQDIYGFLGTITQLKNRRDLMHDAAVSVAQL
jgi:hypothetical protein